MDKLLLLELDYEMDDDERRQVDPQTKEETYPAYRVFTQTLIRAAFMINHAQGMPSEVSRDYRAVIKKVKRAVEDKKDFVVLSDSEFDRVYKEVYKAQYNPVHGLLAPILYDELDRVKHRKREDEEALQERFGVRPALKAVDAHAPEEAES